MLSDTLKQQIQETYRTFLDVRSLKPRYGQKMMIAQVARTLGNIQSDAEGERTSEDHICVIEAGTGTGKTLAYLLGAIPIARETGKSLVISTATVALQEQLVNKDLPEAVALYGGDLTYILAKGRGRYFCVSQAEKVLISQTELGQIALYEDEQAQKLSDQDVQLYKRLLAEFAAGNWSGDRDEWPEELDELRWQAMTSDHTRCTNRRCSNFSVCPFFKARDALDKAAVVVANHDLVLADLSLGGGAILPDPAASIYLFDEAHHLGSKTKNHFAYSLRIRSTQKWLKSADKQLRTLLDECDNHPVLAQYIARMAPAGSEIERLLDLIRSDLSVRLDLQTVRDTYRFPQGALPEPLMVLFRSLAQESERWSLKAEQIVDLLKEALDGGVPDINREVAERRYADMGQLWGRAQAIYWLACSYGAPDPAGSTPVARWINLPDTQDGREFECRSSPITAADTLDKHLWQACYGAVLTSATLTALGSFKRLIEDLGLPAHVVTQTLPSPFHYQEAASLVVPSMATDPGQPDAHTEEIGRYLNQTLLQSSATLVLFSSWRQMHSVRESLDGEHSQKLLIQGDLSKNEILRQHKTRIDAGQSSVIFGLASFAEGVDLPGKYLDEVIITKLPFGVPDDPVDATMAEWIEARGGNAFMEWSVPEASVRLTQATGRLLRTEQDSGRIILLDRRVLTRKYGRQMLDALPPYRREIS